MEDLKQLFSGTAAFQHPILARSLGQLTTSVGGFLVTCSAMYLCLGISLWMSLPLSVLAAGFLVRIFIIQHDCGHGAFFRSQRANNILGSLCSLMTLTPYAFWRRQHARHHGSWNNLDRRAASGLDIYSSCMTVSEYLRLGRRQQRLYRLSRHPIVSHLILPPAVFFALVPFDERLCPGATPSISPFYLGGLLQQPRVGHWIWPDPRGAAADHGAASSWRLAVLSAAPILKGTLCIDPLELRYGRAARLVTPAAAANPAMVYRKYRVPPRPPPQPAYSELSARRRS
jgi:hypothetical protein